MTRVESDYARVPVGSYGRLKSNGCTCELCRSEVLLFVHRKNSESWYQLYGHGCVRLHGTTPLFVCLVQGYNSSIWTGFSLTEDHFGFLWGLLKQSWRRTEAFCGFFIDCNVVIYIIWTGRHVVHSHSLRTVWLELLPSTKCSFQHFMDYAVLLTIINR
jgi:hypothetical protein